VARNASPSTRPAPPPRPGIVSRLVSMLTQVVSTLLVLGAIGAIAWVYLLGRVDREIRSAVEDQIAQQLGSSGLRVTVGSARRVEGRGIELRNLRIARASEATSLLDLEEVFLVCNADVERLATRQIDIQHVEIKRPQLRIVEDAAGRWNIPSLSLQSSGMKKPPTISLHDGQISVKLANGKTTLLRGVEIDLNPEPTANKAKGFEQPFSLKGTFSSDHFRHAEFRGQIDPRTQSWEIDGEVQEFIFSPRLSEALPLPVEAEPLTSLTATVQLEFHSEHYRGLGESPAFSVAARVENGHWEDPRVPFPITDIKATLHASESELRMEDFSARCGKSTLEMAVSLQGYSSGSPCEIHLHARQFELLPELLPSFPESWRVAWEKLSPAGIVHADVHAIYDGKAWQPNVVVDCLDTSFAYYRFPYRMTDGRGQLQFKDGLLTTDNFQAMARDQVVRFRAQVRNPGPEFRGVVEVESNGPVPIDEKMIAALEPKNQNIVRLFRPRGAATIWGRFERKPDGQFDRRIQIGLADCSIEHEQFPYPLEQVSGNLIYTNGQWRFAELRGVKDTAYVVGQGAWNQTDVGELSMRFEATDVPLDDKLRRALKPGAQRLWGNLRPRGSIDHLTIDMRYESNSRNFGLDVRAQKWAPQANLEGRSISFQPTWLPYTWDNVTGSMRYDNGRIELTDVKANHGQTTVALAGQGQFAKDESWQLQFDKFLLSRMKVDRELLGALPSHVAQALARTSFDGQVELQGNVGITGAAGNTPSIRFDVAADVENASLSTAVPLERICGQMQLRGMVNDRGLTGRGDLRIDSLICKDVQVTNIRGPVWLHSDQIVFGDFLESQKPPDRAPRAMTAKMFGGAVAGNARLFFAPDTPFDFDAVVDHVDFAAAARDLMPQHGDVVGKISGSVRMQGTAAGLHTWRGRGTVRLTEADLYEVPVILNLSKVLKAGKPDRTAFTMCDTIFQLEANHIYLEKIDFKGEALTLKGSGDLSLDRRVNLLFYAIVGRDDFNLPIITPALAEISKQLVQIKVEGGIDDPKITKEAVPVINEAIQQMFPELAARSQARTTVREEGKQDGRAFPLLRQSLERNGLTPKR